MQVEAMAAAEAVMSEFGLPLMLKSRKDAYDGKGNAVVRTREGLQAAVDGRWGRTEGHPWGTTWAAPLWEAPLRLQAAFERGAGGKRQGTRRLKKQIMMSILDTGCGTKRGLKR